MSEKIVDSTDIILSSPYRSNPYKVPKKPITRSDTYKLTQELNEKIFEQVKKNIQMSHFTIMKDDIKNYRTLTEIQMNEIEKLTEQEKIEIIKIYNIMMGSIQNLFD